MNKGALRLHKQYSFYCISSEMSIKLGYIYPQPNLAQNNSISQKSLTLKGLR